MTMPKVSVLTPIYNTNETHLRECIESILHQTFTDFEFIILNDSPQNSKLRDIVQSYADKRIKYKENSQNMGISASRNKLLKMARGEYIAIFDHDDISLPTRLEKQVKYLDANPDVGVVGCNTKWFPHGDVKQYSTDNIRIKHDLIQGCAIPHSGAMIRKKVMLNNNISWEAEYSPAEDYMLWIRLMDKTMFHNLPDVLLKYRFFDDNTTNRQAKKMDDRTLLIKNIAYKHFPYTTHHKATNKSWVYLFSLIPILKIKTYADSYKMYLLGFIPLIITRKNEAFK